MSNELVTKFQDLCSDLGVKLTPQQLAQVAAKFSGSVSAASSEEKVILAEAIEAAASSTQAHIREAGRLARIMAARNFVDLNCSEMLLNRQLANSKMTIADRMLLKSMLHQIGAIPA